MPTQKALDGAAKRSVYDALSLYLNFINLFMLLLQLLGNRNNILADIAAETLPGRGVCPPPFFNAEWDEALNLSPYSSHH